MNNDTPAADITLYWRPGCGFCSSLKRQLDKHDLAYDAHNIWDEPDAAAFVRSVARGNETVPTLVVKGQSFVNPSIETVLSALDG
jgi:mycoredoxin